MDTEPPVIVKSENIQSAEFYRIQSKKTPFKRVQNEDEMQNSTDDKLIRKSLADSQVLDANEQYQGILHQKRGSVDSLTSSKDKNKNKNSRSLLPAISGKYSTRSIKQSLQGSRDEKQTPTLPESTCRALKQLVKHDTSENVRRFSEKI